MQTNMNAGYRPPYPGLTAITTLLVISTLIGCDQAQTTKLAEISTSVPTMPEEDATSLLRKMERAYRNAESYSDRGRVVLRYRERGDIRSDEAPLAVATRLPSELRVEAYYSVVVCDGERLQARISDDSSNEMSGQVLSRELDGELTLEQLYDDPTLREAMTNGMGGQPLQLDLLHAEDPLKSLLAEDADCRTLEPAQWDGHDCHRVVAAGAEGEFVFWIDGVTHVLRRLDYPAATLLPELAQSASIQDLSLRVEFRDATFEPTLDDATFGFEFNADAKQVQAFVLPPQPLPTDLFGIRPAEFALYGLQGSKIGQESLLGKTAVLIWFNGHPACRTTLKQLGEVYATRRDDERLAFYVVSTDPSSVSNAQIAATLASWKVDVPLLRDSDACGRDLLGIPWTPTMIVFDDEGNVQIFEVGANTDLARELPTILDRLRDGDDLANEILADQEDQKAKYDQLLKAAMDSSDSAGSQLVPTSDDPVSGLPRAELESR